MKELMMNEDFSDVTLVTEDKKQIKANISILSACSPVFKDVLKKEKHSSPIMFLRGIQYSEMESIMQFVYLGEATFYEERIDEFLAVAKLLEIKELCNADIETNDDLTEVLPPETPTEEMRKASEEKNIIDQVPQTKGLHQNVKYACDQCDYQAKYKISLTRHIQVKHEGVKYACDQCDYQATRQSHLTVHIQSKHEGVKHACDQCDYVAAWKSEIARHKSQNH